MQTLQRAAAVLIFPAIGWLGAACERETPTGATALPPISAATYGTPDRWVNVLDPTPTPPGTSCLDAGYMTISAAVAAANPGDVIQVCPGLYAEQVSIGTNASNVVLNNLTLLGAKVGVDARTRPAPLPTVESIIDHPCGPVQLTADNVTIDGFTVQGSTLSDPCFIAGIWSNPGSQGNKGGYKILNNIVQNNVSGIELDSDCTFPTLVQFNLIQNNSIPGPGSGNGIQTNFGLCRATIDNNKFSGHTNTSMLVVAPSSDLDVTNNELVGGTLERIAFAVVTTATIDNNRSTGSTSSGTIRLFGGNSNITIEGNTLSSGMRGILVDDPFSIGANANVKAHVNNIESNSIAGLEVGAGGHVGTMNAECNWWGSPSGPFNAAMNPTGTGNQVIGNADFIPWLTTPAPGGSCIGGLGLHGMVTGGGQINVSGGRGSFGFSAKDQTQSGHLDYMNHASGAHLNCRVTSVMITPPNKAKLSGPCSSKNAGGASSFTADVEDNDKTMDKFTIKYGITMEGGVIRSGNIQIK